MVELDRVNRVMSRDTGDREGGRDTSVVSNSAHGKPQS